MASEHLVCAMDFPVQKPEDRTNLRDQIDTGLSTEELLGSLGANCGDLCAKDCSSTYQPIP